MREMKDSGIDIVGEIPKSWKLERLRYLCDITTGNQDTQDADPYGEYDFYVRSPKIEKSTKYSFDGEGILMAGDGAGAGRIFHHAYGKYAVHQRVYIINNIREIDSSFLFYYISNVFPKLMDKGSAQSTVPSVRLPMLLNFTLALPDKKKQNLISSYLDTQCSEIDATAEDIQKEISLLEDYKKSVITEAVTKGLNPDAEMKDSGIEWVGKVPVTWKIMPNKYIMTKKKVIKEVYDDENIISLSMNGVIVRDLEAGGKMPKTFDGYQIVYPGNLLMCLFDYDVTPRCIGLIKDYGVTSPAYSQFVMNNDNYSGYYYYYYLMIDHAKTLLHLAKNLRHSFTEEQLGAILAPVPTVEEQYQIVNYLDTKCSEIDTLIADKKRQLDTLADYKKSLIYEYVTGKKEVI